MFKRPELYYVLIFFRGKFLSHGNYVKKKWKNIKKIMNYSTKLTQKTRGNCEKSKFVYTYHVQTYKKDNKRWLRNSY